MKRYAAFLRGINISGKNKVPMAELKEGFEALGFQDVKTYLNSGNVLFSADENDTETIKSEIEEMLKERFSFSVPVFVLLLETLSDILRRAPAWWGGDGKEIYDNLIFVLPPVTADDVQKEIGEPKQGLEKIEAYREAIFWSFVRKDYQKTNWWSKTASAKVSAHLTIRMANTARKMVDMG